MSQRRSGKRNGRAKKQPKVGRMAFKDHANKYAEFSRFKHNAYGIKQE